MVYSSQAKSQFKKHHDGGQQNHPLKRAGGFRAAGQILSIGRFCMFRKNVIQAIATILVFLLVGVLFGIFGFISPRLPPSLTQHLSLSLTITLFFRYSSPTPP
jgi:hypothetical protein